MDPLDIARWQFGITTVYHFMLVPLTLGLGPVVAIMQSLYLRTGNERYLRMTKFWGKLYLINFISGSQRASCRSSSSGWPGASTPDSWATSSAHHWRWRGLLAFFFESTFLGLWNLRLEETLPRIHLATLWLAVIGSLLSAFFIIVANSWMQHPVGIVYQHGRRC